MKTSDKILLCTALGFIGIFVVIDVLHYVNYARGEVLDFAAIEARDYTQHEEEGIRWLVLDGPMRASFYPADRMKVDIDRDAASKFVFRRSGDTLFVSMPPHMGAWSAHENYFRYGNYPSVIVFFPAHPSLRGIRINKGFAILGNAGGLKGLGASLELDSAQCWLGHYDVDGDDARDNEPWDTVRVKAINANFILSKKAHVKVLEMALDAKSEVSELDAHIDSASITGDSSTAIHLHGRNFNKLHFDEVVHPTP